MPAGAMLSGSASHQPALLSPFPIQGQVGHFPAQVHTQPIQAAGVPAQEGPDSLADLGEYVRLYVWESAEARKPWDVHYQAARLERVLNTLSIQRALQE